MKKKIRSILTCLFACLLLTNSNVLAGSFTEDDKEFSFNFNDTDFNNAFSQIGTQSNMKITLKGRYSNNTITKSYENQNINQILNDLLKEYNYIVVDKTKKGARKDIIIMITGYVSKERREPNPIAVDKKIISRTKTPVSKNTSSGEKQLKDTSPSKTSSGKNKTELTTNNRSRTSNQRQSSKSIVTPLNRNKVNTETNKELENNVNHPANINEPSSTVITEDVNTQVGTNEPGANEEEIEPSNQTNLPHLDPPPMPPGFSQ